MLDQGASIPSAMAHLFSPPKSQDRDGPQGGGSEMVAGNTDDAGVPLVCICTEL